MKDLSLSQETAGQLHFWEVDSHFVCPIVGMCLSLEEQKKLLKKSGISCRSMAPYQIHTVLVSCRGNENPLSRRTDTMLRSKFRKDQLALSELDERQSMEHWRACFHEGEYCGVLWGLVTRRGMSEKSKEEIFAMVHMSMHEGSLRCRRLEQRLSHQAEEAHRLNKRLADATRAVRSLRSNIEITTRERDGLRSDLVSARGHMSMLEDRHAQDESRGRIADLEQENHTLKARLEEMLCVLEEREKSNRKLEALNSDLCERTAQYQKMVEDAKNRMQDDLRDILAQRGCNARCPSYDLCKKRILIVGGITRMEAQYRQLVESIGGVFEYHDGYLRNGARNLESSFKRADIVLCPVSCNSHAACSVVKKLSKKHHKPVHLMANSSLKAVSEAIMHETGGHI